jgi:hypothetical protein
VSRSTLALFVSRRTRGHCESQIGVLSATQGIGRKDEDRRYSGVPDGEENKNDGDVVVGKMIFSYYDDIDVEEMVLREEKFVCFYPRRQG